MSTTEQLPVRQLAKKYCPKRIEDFVGLPHVKQTLLAFAAKPFPSAWLFQGSPGTGKSTMALALARAVNAGDIIEVAASQCNVEYVRKLIHHCDYGIWSSDMATWDHPPKYHFVLVDEIDEITYESKLGLQAFIDPHNFLSHFIIVFTTNTVEENDPKRIQKLPERFVSRCHVLNFNGYKMRDELAAHLEHIWQQEAPASEKPPNFTLLAKDARGNVRSALMELEKRLLVVRPAQALVNVPPGSTNAIKILKEWATKSETPVDGAPENVSD
jgi:DNA polymerase III gamma/tau subunit